MLSFSVACLCLPPYPQPRRALGPRNNVDSNSGRQCQFSCNALLFTKSFSVLCSIWCSLELTPLTTLSHYIP
jgi:hypothetical protein